MTTRAGKSLLHVAQYMPSPSITICLPNFQSVCLWKPVVDVAHQDQKTRAVPLAKRERRSKRYFEHHAPREDLSGSMSCLEQQQQMFCSKWQWWKLHRTKIWLLSNSHRMVTMSKTTMSMSSWMWVKWTAKKITYAQRATDNFMIYTVADVPPLHLSILFGFQHFMAMLGATILIALLTIPAMGASARQPADVWNQHSCPDYTLGDRLPIVQGGSFAYLSATFSIINNPSLTDIQD